jgi:ATP-dependent Clp protease ATP-binding subunit ClpC
MPYAQQLTSMTIPSRKALTERAYRVFEFAHYLAAQRGDSVVTPLHIALGVLREREGVAMTALFFCGIAPETLELEFTQALSTGLVNVRGENACSAIVDSDELLERARVEARHLHHSYVGTEHLVLALLHDTTGVPAQVLARHGIGFNDALARVLWILDSDPLRPEPFVPLAGVN